MCELVTLDRDRGLFVSVSKKGVLQYTFEKYAAFF
jgi:hypothetical protein